MSKLSNYLAYLNIIVIIVALCVGSFFIPRAQVDLTANNIHTVSKETINFIHSLKDIVRVDVYATKELPAEIKPMTDNLNVILDNMASANPGKFQVNYFDPNSSQAAASEAEKNGIKPLQFTSVRNDKLEVQTGYFGFIIKYNNKQAVVPVAGDIGNLEYNVVSEINKLVRDKKPKLLIASGNGEWGQDEIGLLQRFVSAEYDTIPVVLNDAKELDSSAATLLIVGPKGPYNENAKKLIKSWVDSRKGLAIWYDPMLVNEGLAMKKVDTGLESFLNEYGISVNPGFLVDEEGGMANFAGKEGNFFLKYKYWPQITGLGINRNIPAASSLSSLVFPWTASLNITGDAQALLSTSKLSYMADWESELNPLTKNETKALDEKGTHIVAAIKSGKERMVVVADADFVRNEFIVNNQQNLVFAINTIDYLSQNESLIGIRSKQIYSSPLPTMTNTQKNIVKAVGILGSVLVLGFIGLATIIIRRRSDKQFLSYVQTK